MQVVMTAAGRGSRFTPTHTMPKPFILVEDVPMWERAIRPWLRYGTPTVVMQESHSKYIGNVNFECDFIFINYYTEGAAETCAIGARSIERDKPVMFVECDSVIEFDHDNWDYSTAGTFVVKRDNPAHSYCKLNGDGFVTEIREKEVISPWANTGHYWFQTAGQFLDTYDLAKKEERKTRGEYYTAPLYNDIIANGDKVKTQLVDQWHCWGTPQDVYEWKNSNTD